MSENIITKVDFKRNNAFIFNASFSCQQCGLVINDNTDFYLICPVAASMHQNNVFLSRRYSVSPVIKDGRCHSILNFESAKDKFHRFKCIAEYCHHNLDKKVK